MIPISRPILFSSKKSTTPAFAAKPKALPPDNVTPWTNFRLFSDFKASVSRVFGDPPRTETPPVTPSSQRITVQPVIASESVYCPI